MTRRALLVAAGAGPLLRRALAFAEPRSISFPLAGIAGSITPADAFFIREHFAEPDLVLKSWRLRVEGRVARTVDWSLADLIEAPTRKIEAVLECAGNGPGGAAVSNAVWGGVPLLHLLREAGAAPEAVSVLLEAADTGRLTSDAPDLPYCQIVPIVKCMQAESLVAFKMNDRFLPRKNGFPARALFPGWYAMDSVKWLKRIIVLGPNDEPADFLASGMHKFYNRIVEVPAGGRTTIRLSEVLVKSAIAWPPDQSKLPAARHTIRGFAWTGAGSIRDVEISADGGRTWERAQFESPSKPFAWTRWKYSWDAAPGSWALISRATDDGGRQQPLTRDPARQDGYEWNHCATVRCEVR
jgi:DMSO/TMAO reductase YedYZ molybdopterin-dependent catalytic subunit